MIEFEDESRVREGNPDPPRPRRRSLGRVLSWAAALLLLILAILSVGVWSLPRLVNVGPLNARLSAAVSARFGGGLAVKSLEFRFSPLPCLTLRGVHLRLAERATVDAESVVLYPRLPPLLLGRVLLSTVALERPSVTVLIPEIPFSDPKSVTLAEAETKVLEALAALQRLTPGLTLKIRDGQVQLTDSKVTRFRIQGLAARVELPPSQVRVRATFVSDISDGVTLDARLDPVLWRGDARLTVSRLRSANLLRYLFPPRGGPVDDGLISANLTLGTSGRGRLWVGVGARVPSATLRLGEESLALRSAEVRGTLVASGKDVQARIDGLSLQEPRLALSGVFSWVSGKSSANAEVRATELDVGLVRRVALALAPKVKGLRIACDVVRGGLIEQVRMKAAASSPADLLSANGVDIRGTVRDVALHLPWVGLEVAGAAGEVEYSKGILSGTRLSGRTEGGVARDSSLRMGFVGRRLPFRLDLNLAADLAPVVPLLHRLVRNLDFQRELALIRDVHGSGVGRLMVGDWLDDLSVRVDTGELDLSGRYDRFPFPLALRVGHLGFEGASVNVTGVRGTAGRSTLAGVSGRVDWRRVPTLDIASGTGRVSLSDVYPWLTTFAPLRATFKDFGPPNGIQVIEELTLHGPFLKPAEWQFRLKGSLEDLTVQSILFPGTLRILRGRVDFTDRTASLAEASIRLLDSSLIGAAQIAEYPSEQPSLTATLDGHLGQRTANWVADLAQAPSWLKVRRPVEVRRSRLARDSKGEFTYSGEHLLEAGPTVGLALRKTATQFALDRLEIHDAATNATLSGTESAGAFDLAFRGVLRRETVDRLLEQNPYFHGFVDGDFSAHLDPKRPRASTLQGGLRFADLEIPRHGGPSLQIRAASLKGDTKRLDIDSCLLSLGGQQAVLKGRVEISADRFRPELTLSAGELDGKALADSLGTESGAGGRWRQTFWDLPVQGNLLIEVSGLRHDQILLSPLRAEARTEGGKKVTLTSSKIGLCGIDLPMRLEWTPEDTVLNLQASVKAADFERTLDCLGHQTDLLTGVFGLTASAHARTSFADPSSLLTVAGGEFTFKANDGRIHRLGVLSKILAILNVTEIFRGRLPDLVKEGFGYRKIRMSGRVENGKLVFEESSIDGASMNLFWTGNIDLATRQADLTVIVAPLKTLDAIVSHIPIVRSILGKAVVSVPVRVTGDIRDPTIIPLSPTAVGRGILGLMERTLLLPYKLVQPLLPRGETKDSKP